MTIAAPVRALCQSLGEAHGVVVLEGCDGVGKTTVAEYLATHHSFTVVHSTRSADGVALVERYRSILRAPGPLALDRSFVSELVYGPIRHGGSRVGWGETVELAGLVVARRGVFVHLTAEPTCVLDRLHARRDGEVWQLDEVQRIQAQYERVFAVLRAHAEVLRQRTDVEI